jgi:hypothetical protein
MNNNLIEGPDHTESLEAILGKELADQLPALHAWDEAIAK